MLLWIFNKFVLCLKYSFWMSLFVAVNDIYFTYSAIFYNWGFSKVIVIRYWGFASKLISEQTFTLWFALNKRISLVTRDS